MLPWKTVLPVSPPAFVSQQMYERLRPREKLNKCYTSCFLGLGCPIRAGTH